MIIKVLFAILVLSVATVIGVAIAVFALVRRHLKSRRSEALLVPETATESAPENLPRQPEG